MRILLLFSLLLIGLNFTAYAQTISKDSLSSLYQSFCDSEMIYSHRYIIHFKENKEMRFLGEKEVKVVGNIQEVTKETWFSNKARARFLRVKRMDDDDPFSKETEPEIFVDEDAEFPGGYPAMLEFIQENLVYPETAIENGLQGKCEIRFVVNKKGVVESVKLILGVPDCPDCDKNAIEVIKSMPNWIPGRLNGDCVNSYARIPINFGFETHEELKTTEEKGNPTPPITIGGTKLFRQHVKKTDYDFYYGEVTTLVNSKNEFSFLLFDYQGAKEVILNNAMPLFYKWPNKEEINNFIGLNKQDKYSYNIEGNLSEDIGKSMVYLTSYEGQAEARPGLKTWLNYEKAPGFKNILYIDSEASWITKEDEKNGACVPLLPDYSRAQFIRARKMNAFHLFDFLDYSEQEMLIYKLASSFAFVHCFENFNAQNSSLKIKFVFDGKENSSEVFIHDTLPLVNALLTETIKKFSFDNKFADSILINEVSDIKINLVDNMSEKHTIVYLDKNKKPIRVNTKNGSTQKLNRTLYMTWGNEVFTYHFDYLIYNFSNHRIKNRLFPLIKLQIPKNSMYFYRII